MALIICSFCGETTSDWNDTCPFCGATLTGEETKVINSVANEIQEEIVSENYVEKDVEEETIEETVETVSEQEELNEAKYCRFCGRELVKGAAFCPFCGKAIHEQMNDTSKDTITTSQQTVQSQTAPIEHQPPAPRPTPQVPQKPQPIVVPTPPLDYQSNGAPAYQQTVQPVNAQVYQQPPRTIVVQQYVPSPQVVYQPAEEKPKKKTGCGTWILFFILMGIIYFILVPAYKSYSKKQEAESLSTNRADYRTDVTYEELSRKPDKYKGTLVCFKGRVVQVLDSSSTVTIRLATKEEQYFGYYDDVVYCTISKSFLNDERLLEDDIITIYGKADGIKEYTAILGNKIQIPSVVVRIVDIEKK